MVCLLFDLRAAECIQQLLHKQLLHEALLRELCEKTQAVLMWEFNVVHVSAPVTVVGDILYMGARFLKSIICIW